MAAAGPIQLSTIGFAGKPASRFFGLLKEHGVGMVVDIRLRPDGQLAGFAKKGDLPYFLRKLCECDYRHFPELAPSDELLKRYRADHDWAAYLQDYERLLDERHIPEVLDRAMFEQAHCCLLCSEPTPEHCHRRPLAERLARVWGNVEITHLV